MNARPPTQQPIRTVALSDWDGTAVRSRALIGHERATQHHISVHGHGATVSLAVRLRPTRLGHALAPLEEMAAIALSPTTPSRDFVVNGFYDLIEVRPLSTPDRARIEVVVASTGDTLNALPRAGGRDFVAPPTTVLALGWDGDTAVEKGLLGHDAQTVHHFAMACDGTPTGGRVRVAARPRGATGFITIVERDVAGDGGVNALITGYFDAVRVEPLAPITGGVRFGIRVASAGEELREPEVPGDNSIRASDLVGGQTPTLVAADTTYTVGADRQVLYAVPIELAPGAALEVLGALIDVSKDP